jgi:hypothetical protein
MLEKSRDPRGVARFRGAIDQYPAGLAGVVIGRVQPLAPAWIVIELPPAGHRLIKLLFETTPGLLAQPSLQGVILLLKGAHLGP